MTTLPDGIPTDTSAFLAQIVTADNEVSQLELENLCFIVTLIDRLHASVYATFLSRSFAKELAAKLRVEALSVSFTLDGVQWKWRRRRGGVEEVTASHAIRADFDLKAQHQLSRVGTMVANGSIGVEEGLKAILAKTADQRFEQLYRQPPGRPFAVALMALGTTTICFGGNLVDGMFASLEGLIAGFLEMFCSEGFVALAISFYSIMVVNDHPETTCFSSQVIGTLFWFYFGTAFIIALFEVASGQLRIGILRLFFALVDSFRHAVGIAVAIVVGVMLLGQDVKDLVIRDCNPMESHSDDRLSLGGIQLRVPLFLILCVAVNSQLRVDIRDWPVCVAVQAITMFTLHICDNLGHSDFQSNFVPSFLAAFSSLALLRIFGRSGGQSHIGKADHELKHRSGTITLRSALRYDQRDAWFCIFPSLYLLIPGSGLVKACLFSIAGLFGFADDDFVPPHFAFVLLQIGLGQVLGIGLGMALFEICSSRRRADRDDTRGLPS